MPTEECTYVEKSFDFEICFLIYIVLIMKKSYRCRKLMEFELFTLNFNFLVNKKSYVFRNFQNLLSNHVSHKFFLVETLIIISIVETLIITSSLFPYHRQFTALFETSLNLTLVDILLFCFWGV